MNVVDSHLHVWDLDAGEYAWLGPERGELYRSFSPAEARAELAVAGVEAAVLVQAEDSLRETDRLLEVGKLFDFVAGVVGWVRLDQPAAAEEALDGFATSSLLRGVRHLVHDDPRDDFLELPAVRRSLQLVMERDLAFDVPDAWPRHLSAVAALADALPDLSIVVDHLGKPPRGRDDLDDWAGALGAVATRPNTVAKVSGLQVEGLPLTATALRPVWETALEKFGPARLMYGSDWPMTFAHGGYQATWQVLTGLVGELSPPEQQQVLGGTARSVYRLEAVC